MIRNLPIRAVEYADKVEVVQEANYTFGSLETFQRAFGFLGTGEVEITSLRFEPYMRKEMIPTPRDSFFYPHSIPTLTPDSKVFITVRSIKVAKDRFN